MVNTRLRTVHLEVLLGTYNLMALMIKIKVPFWDLLFLRV